MEDKILDAIKSRINGTVQKAEPIFNGENSYIVNDSVYVTVFNSTSEMIEFYRKAFLNHEDFQATINVIDHFIGKDKWISMIDQNKLSEYMMSVVGDKKISGSLKYLINDHPIDALKKIFGCERNVNNDMKKVAIRFLNDDKINDLLGKIAVELKVLMIRPEGYRRPLKAFIWPDFGEQ